MTDNDITHRYLCLVNRLEQLEDEKKLLWDEMHRTIECMTEEEVQRVGESLRIGHEVARQALECHIRQLQSPPVE